MLVMTLAFLCIGIVRAQSIEIKKVPPIANNDSVLIGKNQTIEIDVLKNDIDPDGDINLSTIQITSSAQLGLVNIIGGKIEYTPGTNVCGFDSLKYRLTDGNSELSNIATVYIEITCFNIAPIAKNDILILGEDKLDSVDVFDNDRYTDGPNVSYTISKNGSHGNASISPTGMLSYISSINYSGLDTIEYSFCDLDPINSLCDTAFVFITINPINDAPSAINDTLTIYKSKQLNFNLSSNDKSIDGPNLDYHIILSPLNGIASLGVSGTLNYQAGPIVGKDSIQYEVCDLASTSLCDTAWALINILPVYDKAIANNDTLRIKKNSSNYLNIFQNDVFPNLFNSDSIYFTNTPNSGTFTYSSGIITFNPELNFTGSFNIQYRIKDNLDSLSNTATIVLLINEIPTSTNICNLRTIVNQSLLINPFQNAAKGTSDINFNSIQITSNPSNGSIENFNPISRSIKYIPTQNYTGNDSIKFKIVDNDLFFSEEIKVCIEVINDIPVKTNGVISPNGDGINDYLTFDNIDDFPNNEVIIFDRYWNEVFHTKSYSSNNYWTADNLNTGTYFYLVTITVNDLSKTIKGYISILK